MDVILNRDDKLYNELYSLLEEKMSNNKLFQSAVKFTNRYISDTDNYKQAVLSRNKYLRDNEIIQSEIRVYNPSLNYLTSNFISFVNYNGSETYLTNGAFLDVVINQQMCKNTKGIEITKPFMYFTSFIENIADLMTHYHKTKYTERVIKASRELNILLNNFLKSTNSDCIGDFTRVRARIDKNLQEIFNTQINCASDIYNCESFKLIRNCLNCIIVMSEFYYDCYIKRVYKTLDDSIDMFDNIQFPNLQEERPKDTDNYYQSPTIKYHSTSPIKK